MSDHVALKNVVLVGASVSSTDIARDLGPIAKQIYQVHRNGKFDLPASLLPTNATRVEDIESYNVSTLGNLSQLGDDDPIPGTITLKSGHKICGVHHVILCTGYHFTLPFLRQFHSDSTPPHLADENVLVTDSKAT